MNHCDQARIKWVLMTDEKHQDFNLGKKKGFDLPPEQEILSLSYSPTCSCFDIIFSLVPLMRIPEQSCSAL